MITETEASKPAIEQIIAKELSVTRAQIMSAIRLLDAGATVPFIARYRKEATGGLTDTHLRMLADRLDYLRDLEKRRIEIIQSIQDQGKLNDALKAALEKAETKTALEDLYLPFRPKRHSRSQAAKDSGLEPLALSLLGNPNLQPEIAAQEFVNPLKNVADTAQALTGAREILLEKFSEDPELIGFLRKKLWQSGWIYANAMKGTEDPENKFADYLKFREPLNKIPSHRMLALLRGKKEGILSLSLEVDGLLDYSDKKEHEADYIFEVCKRFHIEPKRRPADNWLFETAKLAWKYKIRLHLELDIFSELRRHAEEEAIRVFAENLKDLLLAAPAGSRPTLGLDPGFRTGIKFAALDATGKVLETGAIYPLAPEGRIKEATETFLRVVQKYNLELIAIGNGTASRETDQFVQTVLRQNSNLKINKVIVSEAGASVYSASEKASAELPNLDVSLRGAVSIARRLQDPLAELVKIDPKSIGVGQYQHDVNQRRLEQMLGNVVEDCVNAVGVDVNTASPELLSYVAGLNKRVAARLVEWRNQKGVFKNRLELREVPEMGDRTFEQAAGFLRIQNGDNPLDASAVHPESYPVVEKILMTKSLSIKNLVGNTSLLRSLDAKDWTDERFGLPTVEDILEELEKPGRDPRPEFKTAQFSDTVNGIEDLKLGMILEGAVTNVANFGAFVDIGVHQDGLVHISQISNEFIKDPREVLRVGQIVKVKVLEVDKPRKRISLSMKLSSPSKRF